MTPYEIITVCASLVAMVISLVSLIRTRETSNKQIELEKISAKLAEKQLTKIEETEEREEREGQPIFVVRATNIMGTNPEQTGYKAKITILVENTGQDYLEPKYLTLVSLQDGLWKLCPYASLDHIDIREHDRILGERTITLKPGCNLHDCVIHISYVDKVGIEKIQEYGIFPEGPQAEMPFKVFFTYKKVYRLVPSILWKG